MVSYPEMLRRARSGRSSMRAAGNGPGPLQLYNQEEAMLSLLSTTHATSEPTFSMLRSCGMGNALPRNVLPPFTRSRQHGVVILPRQAG